MKIPAFKVNPAKMILTAVLYRLGYFNHLVAPMLAKYIKELTGKTIRPHIHNAEDILKEIAKTTPVFEDRLVKGIVPDPLPDYARIAATCQTLFLPDGCHIIARIETGAYYTMGLEYLDNLKKHSPLIYRTVRELLAIVFTSGKVPALMPDEVMEWLFPEDMIDEYEDEEGQKSFIKERKFQLDRYRYHILRVKLPDERARRKVLKLAFKRIKRLPTGAVSDEQAAWLRDLSRLACLTMVNQEVTLTDAYNDYDENHIANSFAVLWDDEGEFGQQFYDFMNEQWGNTGAPRLRIIIRNRNDLARTRLFLKTLVLTQKVFYFQPLFP